MLKYSLRGASDADTNFIYSSWLKSYRGSDWARKIPSDIYYRAHGKIITNLLNSASVVVACSEEDPSLILGWAVGGKILDVHTIHYVYVKYPYRKLGIGKTLAGVFVKDGQPTCVTAASWLLPHIREKYQLVYNPYVLET